MNIKAELRPIFVSVLVLVGMIGLFSGCTQDDTNPVNGPNNEPYSFYNKVDLNQAKTDVDAVLGVVPKDDIIENSYIYTDDSTGYGVSITYNATDQVIAKTVFYPDETKTSTLSNAEVTEDQAASISEGMTYNEVKKLLGSDGVEISRVMNPVSGDEPINIRAWINDNETAIMVAFIGNEGIVYKSQFLTN